MEKSQVYFTDMRCKLGDSLLHKLQRLLRRADMEKIDFDRKFVAIKIHFGEPGNLSFLRPNFAKVVADAVKEQGGLPFLTDSNTLYVGRRKHALEHLESAQENGFSSFSTGCQMIIADGLKGTDDVEVPVPGGEYCKTAQIGRAVMDADIVISLSHFKGHEEAGFGGALKNLGMGSGSRAGKMQMHNEGKPQTNPALCRVCGVCFQFCGQDAIACGDDRKAHINHEKCVGCGRCIAACNFDAIENASGIPSATLDCKIVEYAKAVVHGRPSFHINIVNQVSPYCDCHNGNDAPVVPDIGMFASFDPVALDKACIDAVNAATPIQSSIWGNSAHTHHHDPFLDIHPEATWREQIAHGEKIGLGSGEYKLVTVR